MQPTLLMQLPFPFGKPPLRLSWIPYWDPFCFIYSLVEIGSNNKITENFFQLLHKILIFFLRLQKEI